MVKNKTKHQEVMQHSDVENCLKFQMCNQKPEIVGQQMQRLT